MLPFRPGSRPAPRLFGTASGVFVAVFYAFFVLASAADTASALSKTIDLSSPDAPGLEASLTIDDMLEPGSLSVTISLISMFEATGDVRGYIMNFSDGDLFPLLGATGADVYASHFSRSARDGNFCVPCRLRVDLGDEGPYEPTGLQEASFMISHPSIPLSLAGLTGEDFRVVIGVDSPGGDDQESSSSVVKLKGKIPTVPEPSSAILMLLGLTGLSVTARRLELSGSQ
ncbi:MAG: PEP-CTERM sorting domain-containing protein [bacterium]|nr:PEP-CTERM sorting domain-containing protein [bacterium]